MNRNDIKEIIEAGTDEPFYVDGLEMERYEHELIAEAQRACLLLCEANYADGLQRGRNFLYIEKQHRDRDDPDRTSYRTRVRFRYGTTVQAEWYVAKLVKRQVKNINGQSTEQWKVQREEPKRKDNGDYSEHMFKNSPQWVQYCGKEIEESYKIIRRRNAVLSEIRDKLYELDRLNRKLFDLDETIGDRQTQRPDPINQEYVQKLVEEMKVDKA